ncbi:MAG: UDP-N-acetylmuramoyl-L-alanine--D-glutamate ligase [Patescibacteria group bacterium]
MNEKLEQFKRKIAGKKIAVIGLGIEGIALIEFLSDFDVELAVLDQQNEKSLMKKADTYQQEELAKIFQDNTIKKYLGDGYLNDLAEFDIIFRSPSFYFDHPQLVEAKKNGAEISTQIKLFMDLCPCKIIGVTGTKGKGTTASLIFEILNSAFKAQNSEITSKVYLAGNIGYPVMNLLPEIGMNDIVILELSNFQLADLHSSPHIAVVTNLGVDHLDYHNSVEEYHQAKESILRYQTSEDYAVLNRNSTFDEDFLATVKSRKLYFSKDHKNSDAYVGEADGENAAFVKGALLCKESEVKLMGRFNLENIAAAALASSLSGADFSTMKKAVTNFIPLEFRIEFVVEIDGVKYINDSFATNPGPTIAAIESFKEPKILILGGSKKGADFSEMAKVITKNNVIAVVLIGLEGPVIGQALAEAGYGGKVVKGEDTMEKIVMQTKNIALSGNAVIFSPACASFDMFKDYKDRGRKFTEEVNKLR